ncbi:MULTISPECIES: amidohydrolase family protein [unclassified Chelatococcus]|uniref:amidohydrolase family protein n=1 Tax=unclassified Chelatococcus TaxID=2638111 RepID=UPI001BD18B97|nr:MULTISPECIES: amidohydrolase family protein [unclassified Chelatococcus]MBS7701549.1 amidohydrolase [Chelatococcus sp. YT9]MBX3557384.1 amidohydrolase [Chelatococcus sp.]
MFVIDSQIHCWEESAEFPTPDSARANHGAEHTVRQALARMDANGIARSILVPFGSWISDAMKNRYALDAAAKYPNRFAVMGQFEFDLPNAGEALATWRRDGMLGIRRYFRFSAKPLQELDWFWRGLVDHDIPFMSAAPNRMAAFAPVLERFPSLRLIIDHAGREPFDLQDEAVWADLNDTLDLARFRNVSIKVSSLPCFSSAPYPFPVLHEPIHRIYDAFGPDRMLWGSDVTRLKWSFEDNMRLFTEALPFLSDEDKQWIMGRSAAKACRWEMT